MYSSCIADSRIVRATRAVAVTALLFFCGAGTAAVAADDSYATRYATVTAFGAAAADGRFALLAADDDLGDNCLDVALAGDSSGGDGAGSDTILLAKLDTDKKASTVRSKSAAGTTTAANAESAAVPSRAATPLNPEDQEWEIIVSDKTLNAAMARWAATAGWQLLWEIPVDYAVEARTSVRGSFEQAVSIVAKSMESAEIPMKAVFYQGNKVLRIMAKGSE